MMLQIIKKRTRVSKSSNCWCSFFFVQKNQSNDVCMYKSSLIGSIFKHKTRVIKVLEVAYSHMRRVDHLKKSLRTFLNSFFMTW